MPRDTKKSCAGPDMYYSGSWCSRSPESPLTGGSLKKCLVGLEHDKKSSKMGGINSLFLLMSLKAIPRKMCHPGVNELEHFIMQATFK